MRGLAVGLYLAVTRTLLGVAVLVPSLYFALNASPFPDRLTSLLRSVLPGALEFGHIQISPVPWQVDVLDVRIRAPDGQAVISAGTVRVKLDLVPLARFLAGRAPELHLHFREVQLQDYEALVDFDEAGHLHLVDAFDTPRDPSAPPKPPSAGPKLVVRLTFDRITGQRGACRVSFPEWDIRVEGVVLSAKLFIVTAPQTHVRVEASQVTWTHGLGHVRAAPGVAAIPREAALGPGRVDGFLFDWDRIAFQAADFTFPGLSVKARDGFLAWAENLRYHGEADLSFPPGSPLVEQALGGALSGALSLRVQARGDHDDPRFQLQAESPSLSAGPLDLGRASLSLTGGRDETGRYAFQGIRAESDGPLGKVRVEGGTFHPFGSAEGLQSDLSAVVEAEGLDLPALLGALGTGVPGPPVPLPRTVSGHLQAGLDVVSWGQRVAVLRLAGRLGATLPPGTLLDGTEAGLDLDLEAETAGRFDLPRVRLAAATLRSGADLARWRGEVDLGTGALDLAGSVQKDLATVLPLMGLRGRGRASLSDLRVRGTLASPRAEAAATLSDLEVAPWSARQASGRVLWQDGALSVTGLEAQTPAGPLGAGLLEVRLLEPGAWRPLAVPTLRLQDAAAPVTDLARVPPLAGSGLAGRASLSVARLRLALGDPLRTLDLRGRVVAARLSAWERPLTDAVLALEAADGVLAVPSAVATPPGGGVVRLEGTLDLRTLAVQGRGDATGVSLALLAGVKESTLRGTLDLQASVSGSLADPALEAHAAVRGLAVMDRRYADLEVDAARQPGEDLRLSSERFLPRMHLNPDSGLAWRDGRFTGAVLMIDLNRVTPQDLWPSLRERDVWGQFTGNVQVRYGFGEGGRLAASATAPPDGLRLAFLDREVRLRNVEKLVVSLDPDLSARVRGLALDDGKGLLRACGTRGPDGDLDLWVRGAVGAYWLRALAQTFSVADGMVHLGGTPGVPPGPAPAGCDPALGADGDVLAVRGTLSRPLAEGTLRLGAVELGLRGLGDLVRLREGGRVVLSAAGNRLRAAIPDDGWVRGAWGEGTFTLYGQAAFDGLVPGEGELALDGAGLSYVSPGEYFLTGNPSVTARFEGLGTPGRSRMRIAGRVVLTEGSYHRNFDVVSKAFSGVTGQRVAQRGGTPLEDRLPWLADADLDVAVTGSPLAVRSQLPVGSTDFELVPDVRIRGQVKAPELWNRIEVLPGGKVTYDVVRRDFEVVRGSLDFDGPLGRPQVEVTARTRIEVSGGGNGGTASAGTSRYAPDAPGQSAFDQGLLVTLRVAGRYPDLDISLSSNSRAYSQTDLQYLVLTGTLPQGAAAGGGMGQIISLGLLTEDVTNLATNLLLGSLVDTINLGVSPQGELNLDVMAHMGSRLRFETQVLQGSGSSRYRAGFNVRLTDRLSLVGRVRSGDRDQDGTELGQRYETKLQFRIPLE